MAGWKLVRGWVEGDGMWIVSAKKKAYRGNEANVLVLCV